MDSEEFPSDPFRRSGRVSRSPPKKGNIMDPKTYEGSRVELEGDPGTSQKRKEQSSPPTASVSKKTPGEADGDTDEEEIEVEEEGKVEEINRICSHMSRLAMSQAKSKKITSLQQADIVQNMNRIMALVRVMDRDVAHLEGRLAERIKIEKVIANEPAVRVEPKTFAEATKSTGVRPQKITAVSAKIRAPKVVFIKSSDEKVDVAEVKEVLKKAVQPGKMGIKIKRLVKTARGLMVEAEGEDQIAKLTTCSQLAGKGLIFDRPKKRLPRLMIYDVELMEELEELVTEIYEQNLADSETSLDEFKKEFRIQHVYKRRDPKDTRVTMVAECSPKMRNLIRQRDRLYIGWQSCRVKDFNPLVRCFKCQAFGHVAKYCRGKSACGHCTAEHDTRDCPDRSQPAKCQNCKLAKREFSRGRK